LVVVVQAVADVARYGSVALDHDGRVTEFIEKGGRAGPGLINAGVVASKADRPRLASGDSHLPREGCFSPPSRPWGLWVGLPGALHRHRNTGRPAPSTNLAGSAHAGRKSSQH
jgi:hypothetical protein